jgi:hypothetical protein
LHYDPQFLIERHIYKSRARKESGYSSKIVVLRVTVFVPLLTPGTNPPKNVLFPILYEIDTVTGEADVVIEVVVLLAETMDTVVLLMSLLCRNDPEATVCI